MVIIVDHSASKESEFSQNALGSRGCSSTSSSLDATQLSETQNDDSTSRNSSSDFDQNDNLTSSSFAPPGATKHDESRTKTHPQHQQQEGNLLPLNDLALLLATQLTEAQKNGLFRSEPYLRMSSRKIPAISTPGTPASKTARRRNSLGASVA
jgi:hypothetical protein